MPHRVYEVRDHDRERLAADVSQPPLDRLSLEWREARHFGVDRDTVFLVLQGPEEALVIADEVLLEYARFPDEAENVLGWLRWEADAAARAVGAAFGPVPDVVPAKRPPPPPVWKRVWDWLKA